MSYKIVPRQKAKPGDTNPPVNLHHEGKNDSLIKNNSFRIGVWDFTLSGMKWHPPSASRHRLPVYTGFGSEQSLVSSPIKDWNLKFIQSWVFWVVAILSRGHF